MYEVVLSHQARKALKRATHEDRLRFRDAFERLSIDPRSGKRLHGELEGWFALRVGGMRAIYELNTDTATVVVHDIGSRGDIYK